MSAAPSPGAVDLAVRFGDQVRLKCPDCRRFVADSPETVACASCGQRYARTTGTTFVRLAT